MKLPTIDSNVYQYLLLGLLVGAFFIFFTCVLCLGICAEIKCCLCIRINRILPKRRLKRRSANNLRNSGRKINSAARYRQHAFRLVNNLTPTFTKTLINGNNLAVVTTVIEENRSPKAERNLHKKNDKPNHNGLETIPEDSPELLTDPITSRTYFYIVIDLICSSSKLKKNLSTTI